MNSLLTTAIITLIIAALVIAYFITQNECADPDYFLGIFAFIFIVIALAMGLTFGLIYCVVNTLSSI